MADTRRGVTKLTVLLPDATVDTLCRMAEQRGVTVAYVLRSAIATEKLLSDKERAGATILLQESDDSVYRMAINR